MIDKSTKTSNIITYGYSFISKWDVSGQFLTNMLTDQSVIWAASWTIHHKFLLFAAGSAILMLDGRFTGNDAFVWSNVTVFNVISMLSASPFTVHWTDTVSGLYQSTAYANPTAVSHEKSSRDRWGDFYCEAITGNMM